MREQRLPRRVRYLLLALLVAVVGIGLATVLYDIGVLPIAGPFALILLLPVLFPLQRRGNRRRRERLADRRRERPQTPAPSPAERCPPPPVQRTGGAIGDDPRPAYSWAT